MRSYKDVGLIVRIKQLAEADKLIVILTGNNGRVEAVARGAGKPLSRKSAGLDLLNLAQFNFHKSQGLDLITEVNTIKDYHELKQDFLNISELLYLLEIIDKFRISSEDDQSTFYTIIDFLDYLAENKCNPFLIIAALELKLIENSGFGPILGNCLHCGDTLKPGSPRIAASSGQAGYLCNKHFSDSNFEQKLVDDRILKIQKYLLLKDFSAVESLAVDPDTLERIKSIQQMWIKAITEKDLSSLTLLNKTLTNYAVKTSRSG